MSEHEQTRRFEKVNETKPICCPKCGWVLDANGFCGHCRNFPLGKRIIPIKIHEDLHVVEIKGGHGFRIGNIQTEQYLKENLGKEIFVEMGPNMKIYRKMKRR